jgi:hypothetical protein
VKIGSPGAGQVDVVLPAPFKAAPDCVVQLTRESGRLWLDESVLGGHRTTDSNPPGRLPVEAGDRMVVSVGEIGAELLFATCRPGRNSGAFI